MLLGAHMGKCDEARHRESWWIHQKERGGGSVAEPCSHDAIGANGLPLIFLCKYYLKHDEKSPLTKLRRNLSCPLILDEGD